jgi:hypothetical protein
MQDSPGFSPFEGSPAPQKKPDTSLGGYPAGGIRPGIDHIHKRIILSMSIFGYRVTAVLIYRKKCSKLTKTV